MIQKFHSTTCPSCQADLTVVNSVNIHFSVAEHEFDLVSDIQVNGHLIDRERLVENGYHAGSFCRACDEQLEELKPAVRRYSWDELIVALCGLSHPHRQQDITVCDSEGEFFRCLSFEQVSEDDDVLDKGHWFLRMETVEVVVEKYRSDLIEEARNKGVPIVVKQPDPTLVEEMETILSREKDKPLPIPSEVATLVHDLMSQVNVRPPSKMSGMEKQSACRRAANMLTRLAAEVVSLQDRNV